MKLQPHDAKLDPIPAKKLTTKKPWVTPFIRTLDPEKDKELIEAFKEKVDLS